MRHRGAGRRHHARAGAADEGVHQHPAEEEVPVHRRAEQGRPALRVEGEQQRAVPGDAEAAVARRRRGVRAAGEPDHRGLRGGGAERRALLPQQGGALDGVARADLCAHRRGALGPAARARADHAEADGDAADVPRGAARGVRARGQGDGGARHVHRRHPRQRHPAPERHDRDLRHERADRDDHPRAADAAADEGAAREDAVRAQQGGQGGDGAEGLRQRARERRVRLAARGRAPGRRPRGGQARGAG